MSNVDVALLEIAQDGLLLRPGAKAGQHLDAHAEGSKRSLNVV